MSSLTPIKSKRERRKSNAFTSLTQTQISELREAFDILDSNDDKKITFSDLINFSTKFQALTTQEIENMLIELPEPTYISLLTFFADLLGLIDEESVLKEDLNNLTEFGVLNIDDLCFKLKLNEQERDLIFRNISSREGIVDIEKLCSLLKHGELVRNI
ncbi:Myosin regulatory light chain [Cucumispora dikerogammari]|nr:Myosin regulatory light chain [Cucumispora dikerogammari]